MKDGATTDLAHQATVSIPGRFVSVVEQHPSHLAISTPDVRWTYTDLDRFSTALAAQLFDRVGPGNEVVALLLSHGPMLIAAVLGALKAGKMYLALDPADPSQRLNCILTDSCARLVLADKSNLDLARQLAAHRLNLLQIHDQVATFSCAPELPNVPATAGAWLMYTSGSTGTPKGVWQDHRGVIHQAEVYAELAKVTSADRLSLLTPLSLAASTTHMFAALLCGATLCPFDVRTQGVNRLTRWLEARRVTVYHSVPTVFRHWMRSLRDGETPEYLRLVRLGGEAVLAGDFELFRSHCSDACVLFHALSSTETGLTCAMLIDKQTLLPPGCVPVGRPVRDVEVLLTDEEGQPASGKGRITIRSRYLARGYWQDPDATATAFQKDATDPGRRVFISNDLGRFRPDGTLEFLGRADLQVKIRGQRVDMGEVESVLRSVATVGDALVKAVDDGHGENRLVAWVATANPGEALRRACRAALRSRLPSHMIPSDFVWLDKLPQTAGGKLDRMALKAQSYQTSPKVPRSRGPKPRDGIERKVARVWESVLGISGLSRTDDFFELGATSLQATEALVGLEEMFGLVLSPGVLVEHTTVETLAAVIADHTVARSTRCLLLLQASSSGTPLFLVHSGHGDVATYGQLARQLHGRPVYGLQAVGLQGESWPQMSVRAMARRYLPEILDAHPHGPYLLGGTCMGGLVAFELACLLVRQGRDVRFVGMMDTPAPPFSGRRSGWTEMLLDPIRDTLRIVRWALLRALGSGRHGRSLPAYRHFIGSVTSRARFYYRPRYYPGRITVFASADTAFRREDRRRLMGRYAKEMRFITLPGRREELFLQPALGELAKQLRSCLDRAEAISSHHGE